MKSYLIAEDERYAFEKLKMMMDKLYPGYHLATWVETVEQTVNFLKDNEVDLIFLDIQLADGSSFEIFDIIEVNTPIIFTTAFDEYAIKAFKVNSIDYLLKPIENSELSQAIEKLEKLGRELILGKDYKVVNDPSLIGIKKNRFIVQKHDGYSYVDTADIAFFYSEEKVTFLHTMSDKRFIIDHSLDKLELMLDAMMFFRVSRNCIANISSIRSVLKYFNSRLKINFEPVCPQEVIVSRIRVGEFLKWIDGDSTNIR